MSSGNPTVSDVFHTEYVSGVQALFQNKGHTYGALSHRKVIHGASEAQFEQGGLLTAGPKVAGQIPRQKGDHKKIKLGAEKNYAMVEIEQFDLDQMATDDRDIKKTEAAMAMARRSDEIWRAAALLSDTTPVGGSGEFMSPALSQEINRWFISKFIMPYYPVYVSIPEMGWSQLMRFKEFANSQYTGSVLPWQADGAQMARTWDGKHWICDPLLPTISGSIIQGYAWTPTVMAEVAVGDINSIFSWENSEDLWLINNNFSQGNIIKPALKVGMLPVQIDTSILPESIDPETYEVSA